VTIPPDVEAPDAGVEGIDVGRARGASGETRGILFGVWRGGGVGD